jgi:hypothetical protein
MKSDDLLNIQNYSGTKKAPRPPGAERDASIKSTLTYQFALI